MDISVASAPSALPNGPMPSFSGQPSLPNHSYFPVPFHLQQPYVASPPPAPQIAPLPGAYPLPQFQQVQQQLFLKDAQVITPEALETVKAALVSSDKEQKAEVKRKAIPRKAAGQSWEDPTLAEWPENDFRLFCGDLGNEVNDDVLSKAFSRFPSFNKARKPTRVHGIQLRDTSAVSQNRTIRFPRDIVCRENSSCIMEVVRDKHTGKTKGYGFVSFSNPMDLAAALKEMNGKYVGNRPIKLRKSKWRDRMDYDALNSQKNQPQKKQKLPKNSVLHK